MRGTQEQIAAYLASAANLLGRYGVDLAFPSGLDAVELLEDANGNLSYELLGNLPGSQNAAGSELAIREGFERLGPDQFERIRYEFELVDRGRDFRRAFHMHFTEWFIERYQVVVHEHCERPVGRVACEHYEGSPIKDAFAGTVKLIDAWTDAPPDCAVLACLD
jgi:hypothetical protein